MRAEHFDPKQWPHGLRCMDCNEVFTPGQVIRERLIGFQEESAMVEIICSACELGVQV